MSGALMNRYAVLSVAVLAVLCATGVTAQPAVDADAKDPEREWTGSLGAGLAATGGNSDTQTYNVGFDVAHDPGAGNLITLDALYLRGEQEGELNVNRATVGLRNERTLSERTFLFGQVDYLRDTFKRIDYFIAPGMGAGYKLILNEQTLLSVDGGVGAVWEKNPGQDVLTSGALTAGQSLKRELSTRAAVTQSVTALWKTDDLADALYTLAVGLAASITQRSQLKVEFLDTFKNRAADPTTKKNDTAFVTSIGYQF